MRSHQDYIKYLEQDGTVSLKTKAEVEAMCGFIWQENINGVADFSRTPYPEPHQQIADNSAKLVLKHFSDEIGYGIVTDKNSTPIPADQVICIYEGTQDSFPPGDYRLGVVNAAHHGNIARFVLHLPTNFELQQYEFKAPLTADDVATANVNIRFLDNEGVYPTLVSGRSIEPGEIIGYSYHYDFWDSRVRDPALFTKTGEIIDPALYERTPEKRRLHDEITEPLENIRGSGWDCDEIDEACSSCKTIEEFNATLHAMTLSFCSKTMGSEAIFYMSVYLEFIVDMLAKVALQLPEIQADLITRRVRPIKSTIRFFDRGIELNKDDIDNIASELESIFAEEALQDQPALSSAHEMLNQFKL